MAARAETAAPRSFGFPRTRRVCKPGEFKSAYASGRRMGNEFFTLNARPNDLPAARLGMSVAVRAMGGAVARNRVRRMIRESFRLNQSILPALDIIVGVRAAARGAEAAQLRSSLERLWQKLK